MITYRKASIYDVQAMNEIFGSYFCMPHVFVDAVEAQLCFVACREDEVVGAAKVINANQSIFEDWEIEFLAVKKHYWRQGIAEHLLRIATEDLHGNIYVSAWRTWQNPEKAHLHSSLIAAGFHLEDKVYKHWTAKHVCKKTKCTYANKDKNPTCQCWEDIYMLTKT